MGGCTVQDFLEVKMELTKRFLEQTFKETLIEYSKYIRKLPIISLKYISPDKFLEDVKHNTIVKQIVRLGAIKDFNNEYPNFVAVYTIDKSPIVYAVTGSYKITVCYELAKKLLKPFKSHEVREYLKHIFAHEITHIIEDSIKEENPDLWEAAKQKTGLTDPKFSDVVDAYAYEVVAEEMANQIGNKELFDIVREALWKPIYDRLHEILKGKKVFIDAKDIH